MGIYKRGKTWYIDYYDQYGRRHRERVGPSKRQAEQALAKRKIEVTENKFLDKKKQEKIKFKDFTLEFIEYYSKPNKRSWKRDTQLVNNLTAFLEDKHLHEITPFDIEKYKKERVKKVTPATVNRELSCLRNIYNRAIQWGKATRNPVKGVKFFKESEGRLRYLEQNEISRLLQECPYYLKPIVIVALNTGMRLGEILNLKWQDLDFNQKFIYIENSKNGEKREVPMNNFLLKMMAQLKETSNHGDYIFSHKDGSPLKGVYRSFKSACKRAGIKNFRFHDLRHTFASHLVMNGVDLKTVQELMGHKSFSMTLRYAHLSPDHKRKAIEDLGNRMQKVVTIWSQKENLTNCQN